MPSSEGLAKLRHSYANCNPQFKYQAFLADVPYRKTDSDQWMYGDWKKEQENSVYAMPSILIGRGMSSIELESGSVLVPRDWEKCVKYVGIFNIYPVAGGIFKARLVVYEYSGQSLKDSVLHVFPGQLIEEIQAPSETYKFVMQKPVGTLFNAVMDMGKFKFFHQGDGVRVSTDKLRVENPAKTASYLEPPEMNKKVALARADGKS